MRTKFEFYNHANNELLLPIYSFKKGEWLDEPITYRNTLLGAMHPGIPMCLGKVPTLRELKGDEAEMERYIKLMRKGIKLGDLTLNFNFSSNSRTHGVGIFTGADVASMYFGENNPMAYINYGSVLVTGTRKMITLELKVLIVDDEIPEVRNTGLGDSHGRCKPELLTILSSNVDGQVPEGELYTPLQVRVGFPGKFIFKGTIIGFNRGVIPPGLKERYGKKGEGTDWDLVLPLSGIKGNKPSDGTNLRKETIYIGNVYYADFREVKVSQQFYMWFSKKAIEKDVLPGIHQECQKMAAALNDRTLLPELFRELDREADLEHAGQIDPESGEPVLDTSEESKEKWISPVVEILDADKNGVLLNHPYINSKIRQLLGRTWLRLALNGDKRFRSVMMQPDDRVPFGSFVCGELPKGWHIIFRNPILSFDSIRLAYNMKDKSYPYYESLRGTAVMSHKTASEYQGDFDGDFMTIIPLNKDQQKFAQELFDIDDDIIFGDNHFENYVKDKLELEGDKFLHIIFEVYNFNRIWGFSPIIKKPDKVKSNKSLEEIFYISMDNPTGLISSTIQSATTNGTIRKVLRYRNHNPYTNEYSNEYYEMSILQFLAQQMQISVDRLKSTIYNDMVGIEATRKFVLSFGRGAWFGKPDQGGKNFYKHKEAYVNFSIPTGTIDEDGVISEEINEYDVVSSMINVVNKYWKEWAESKHHVSEYSHLFPEDAFDLDIEERAKMIHRQYGAGISKALTIGKTDPSDKDGADFVDERRNAVFKVMLEVNNYLVEEQDAERLIKEEFERNGPVVIDILASLDEEGHSLRSRLIPTNDTSDYPISGIWERPDRSGYEITEAKNYAAAMWRAAHSKSAKRESKGSTPFFLYTEEIIKQLNKVEKKMNKARYFASNKFPLGDIIFASPDCEAKRNSDNEFRPRQCVKRDGDPSIFMPSRIEGRELADVNSDSGVVVPNSVEIMVKDEGSNNDRAKSKKYAIYLRSNQNKPWSVLGIIGTGEPVPELDKTFRAKVYTYALTTNPEKLKTKAFTNERPRFRSKGGIIVWEDYSV